MQLLPMNAKNHRPTNQTRCVATPAMRRTLLAICLCLLSGLAHAASIDPATRDLTVRACASCHNLRLLSPRSANAWELTVARMRAMVFDEQKAWSEAEGRRIVAFLARHIGEESFEPNNDPVDLVFGKLANDIYLPAAEVAALPEAANGVRPVQTEPLIVAGVTLVPVAARHRLANLPRDLRRRLAAGRWRPPMWAYAGAAVCGVLALIFLSGLFATGHLRRRLGSRFRPLHALCALGLFLSLAVHGSVFLTQYHLPPVGWFWTGLVGFLAAVAVQLQGIVRKRFGRIFLRFHIAGAYLAIGLTILHWVWAWDWS
jgi:hypothetical protein